MQSSFMQALRLENQQLTLRDDVDLPIPAPDEALVKVRLAGICPTGLELRYGDRLLN